MTSLGSNKTWICNCDIEVYSTNRHQGENMCVVMMSKRL